MIKWTLFLVILMDAGAFAVGYALAGPYLSESAVFSGELMDPDTPGTNSLPGK